MAIIEQGVGVGWKPLEVWSGAVATRANQSPALSRPIFLSDDGWFLSTSSNAKMLRFYIPSRLWTTMTDATDPGYTWGVHWKLAVVFGAAVISPNDLTQAAYYTGSQLQLTKGYAPITSPVRPAAWFPTPGVPEFVSCQAAAYMSVALILASTLTQTVVCPIDVSCGETWSG